MNSYYIKERNMEMNYIELRLLLFIDCEKKYKVITQILNFLNNNGFINHLTMLYSENMRAENIPEKNDIMSLTVDMRNGHMRFKFWNGASVTWVYHTQDLFDAMQTGREKFSDIYDKYEPITEILLNFKKKWSTSIYDISYSYSSTDDVEAVYHIVFTDEVKDAEYENILMEKINKEIIMLGKEVIKDLKFSIEYSFKEVGCSPCERARKEREKNESKKELGKDV